MKRSMMRFRHAHGVLLALALGAGSFGTACSDDKPTNAPEATTSATPTTDDTKSIALVEIAAPADFIVYGGADDLLGLLSAGDGLAKQLSPGGPGMTDMLIPAIQDQLALKGDAGLALDKPLRFAIIDPKKHQKNALVLILSIKGREGFEKALPETHKKDVDGNALSWSASGKDIYANFIGETLVLTPDKTTFATHRKEGLETLKKQAKPPALVEGGDSAAAGVGDIFNWLGGAVRELDKIEVTGRASDDGAILNLVVHAKAGSDTQKTLESIEPSGDKLVAKLPANTAGFLSVSVKPASLDKLERLIKWSTSLGFGGTAPDEMVAASMDYWKSSTGEFAMAAMPVEGTEGLKFVMITGVKDADAARKSKRKMVAMYDDPETKKIYEKMGLDLTYREAAYKIGDIEVDTSKTKRSGPAANNPGMELMKSFMSTHAAIADDWSVLTYGDDGKKVLEAFLGGKLEGDVTKTPGVQRAYGNAAPGRFMFTYVNTGRLSRALATDAASMLVPIEGPGLALSVGAKDGKLHIALDLPSKDVTGIMMLATQAQGALLGGVSGLSAPPPGLSAPPGLQPSPVQAPGAGPGAPVAPGKPATLK